MRPRKGGVLALERELQKPTLFEMLQMVRGDVGDGGGEIEAIYMPPRWLRRK